MTTARQTQRSAARNAEQRRDNGTYHHGEQTVVIGLRVSVAWRDAMLDAMNESINGIGDGSLSKFVQHHAGKSAMYKWGRAS